VSLEVVGWYLSIFFWLFFTGLGMPPCPEEGGILYAAGLSALHPQVHWWLAWPAAGAGILCADTVLYFLGRWWGEKLLTSRWVRWLLPEDKQRRLQARLRKTGFPILLLARILPPARTGVFLIAGTARVPLLQFLIADLIYVVFGVGIIFFGGAWVIGTLRKADYWLVGITAGGVAFYVLYRAYRYFRRQHPTGTG
jgi:membrane protein DedA with SNARE-associated domain